MTSSSSTGRYRLENASRPHTAPPRRTASLQPSTVRREFSHLAPQAAKASWVAFLFTYGFSYIFRQAFRTEVRSIFVVTVTVFAALGLVFGIMGLRGVRKYGARGVLIHGLIGTVLNGLYLGAMVVGFCIGWQNHQRWEERSRKFEAALVDYLRDVQRGVPDAQFPSTGDAELDAAFRVLSGLINDVPAIIAKADAELTQLDEKGLCSVLQNKTALESERAKRAAAQVIIQKARDDVSTKIDRARETLSGPTFQQLSRKDLGRYFDQGGVFRLNGDELLSLALAREQAEHDILQLMSAEFGKYRLLDDGPRFLLPAKQQEYARLSQRIEDVNQKLDDFKRRQRDLQEATPEQLKERIHSGFSRE